MPQARSWPEDEIERRSFTLAALIRQAWSVVARTLLQRRQSHNTLTLSDLGNLPELWAQQTDQKIVPQIGMALYDGADKILLDINAEPQWEVFEDFVERYLKAATNRLVDIGDDVWALVQQQLLTSYGLSEDYNVLAARIQHTAGVSDARALMIARTEMHAALEAGSYGQALLVDPDGKKTWLATHDDRTRETHRDANDQVVLLTESFLVGGSPLRYPGDPLGPPGESINCRCSVVYTLGETVASSQEDDSISPVSDREMATAAGGRKFTSAAHPRGHDGKFITKGSPLFKLLTGDYSSHTEVAKAIGKTTQVEWDALKPEQHDKISDLAKKVDKDLGTHSQAKIAGLKVGFHAVAPTSAPSTHSSPGAAHGPDVPSNVDAVPGDIYKPHPDGHIVAMSADGQERLRWDVTQKKYLRQTKSPDGTWTQSGPPLIKKTAYDFLMSKKGTTQSWRKPKKSATPKAATTPTVTPSTKDLLTAPKEPITPDVTPSVSPFKVLSEEERGKSGDGYAASGLWGRYGAAGVMIRSVGDDGKPRYLLVQRGPLVSSNKGKWQLPGGAIDEHETPEQGAAREIFEEIGAPQAYLDSMEHKGTHATEVPVPGEKPWVYSNIAADAPDMFDPKVDGSETSDAQWLTREEIEKLAADGVLHPALAKNLNNVFDLYDGEAQAPSVETPKAAAPESESVTPAGVGTHLNVDAPIPLGHLKKISGQGGSNAGGTYEAPDGKRYYVKKAKTKNHARNEVLAAQLYAAAGIETPTVSAGEGIPDLGSGIHTYTPLVHGAQQDLSAKLKDPAYRAKIRDGFVIDAWLANWDVAGLGYDNIITDENGNPVRIDVGGSILYRAQGGEKGSSFGDTVPELDTLRDSSVNPSAAKIFGGMTDDEIRQSAAHLEAVTPEQIDKMVADAGLPQSLAEKLKMRREYILKKYPPMTGQKPTADTTPAAIVTPQVPAQISTLGVLTAMLSTNDSTPPAPLTNLDGWPSLSVGDWKSIDQGGNLYDDGQVIAQSVDGTLKITYDAPNAQYKVQIWNPYTDTWSVSPGVIPDGKLSTSKLNSIGPWYLPEDTQLTPAPTHPALSTRSTNAPSKTFWQPEHEIYWGTVTNDAESGFIDDGDVVAVSSDGSLRVRYSHNSDQFVVSNFNKVYLDWFNVDVVSIQSGDIDAEMQQVLSTYADDYNSSWLTPDAFDAKQNPDAPNIPHITAMLPENATPTSLKSWEIWDLHVARPTIGLVLAHAITDSGDTWEAKSGGPSGGIQIFKNGTKFTTEKNDKSLAAFMDANQHIKWQPGATSQTTPSSPSLAAQANLVKFTDSLGNVDWDALIHASNDGDILSGTVVAHTTDGKLQVVTQGSPGQQYILIQLKNQDGSWNTLESAFVSELGTITADYTKATSGSQPTDWQVSPFASASSLGALLTPQPITNKFLDSSGFIDWDAIATASADGEIPNDTIIAHNDDDSIQIIVYGKPGSQTARIKQKYGADKWTTIHAVDISDLESAVSDLGHADMWHITPFASASSLSVPSAQQSMINGGYPTVDADFDIDGVMSDASISLFAPASALVNVLVATAPGIGDATVLAVGKTRGGVKKRLIYVPDANVVRIQSFEHGAWKTKATFSPSDADSISSMMKYQTPVWKNTNDSLVPSPSVPHTSTQVPSGNTRPVAILGPEDESIINFWPGVDVPGKYADGEVVAQSKSGRSKIIWNAQTDRYDRLDWLTYGGGGGWQHSYSYDLGLLEDAVSDSFFDWYIPNKTTSATPTPSTPVSGFTKLLTSDELPKTTDNIDIEYATTHETNPQVSGHHIALQANAAKEGDIIAIGISTTGSGTKWRAVKKGKGSVDFQSQVAGSSKWSTMSITSSSSEIASHGSSPAIKWVQPTAVTPTPAPASNVVGFIPSTPFTPGFHIVSTDHQVDHAAILGGNDVLDLPMNADAIKELIANTDDSMSSSQVLAYGSDGHTTSRLIYSPVANELRVQHQNSIGDWVTMSSVDLSGVTKSPYTKILDVMRVQGGTWKSAWNSKIKASNSTGTVSGEHNVVGFTPSTTFTPGLHSVSSDDIVDIAAIIDGDDVPNMPMNVSSIGDLLNYTDFTAGRQVLAYGGDKKSRIVYDPTANEVWLEHLTLGGAWSLIAWTGASDAASDPAAMLDGMQLQSATWKSAWNSKIKAPGSSTPMPVSSGPVNELSPKDAQELFSAPNHIPLGLTPSHLHSLLTGADSSLGAGTQVLAYGYGGHTRLVYDPNTSEVTLQTLPVGGSKWHDIATADAGDATQDSSLILDHMKKQTYSWISAKKNSPSGASPTSTSTTLDATSLNIQAQQLTQAIIAAYKSAPYGGVLHATHDNDGNEVLFTRAAPYIRVVKNGVLVKNIHNSDDQALIDYIKSIQPGLTSPQASPSVYSVPVTLTGELHTPSVADAVNSGSYGDIIATGEDSNGEKYQLRVGSGNTLGLLHDNGNGHYYAFSSMGLLGPSSDLNYLFTGISSGVQHEDIKWAPGSTAPSDKKPAVPTPPTSTAPSSLPTSGPQITFPDGGSYPMGEQIKSWGPLTAKSQWKKPYHSAKPTIIAATKDGNYRIVLTSSKYYRREKYNHSTKLWESEASETHKLAPLGKGKTWFKVGGPQGVTSGSSSGASAPSAPTATQTSAQLPSVPAGTGSFPTGPGDIAHLSDVDKKAMYAHFRTFNVYSSGDNFAMFKAVKATADKYNISLMQALRVIDEQRMVKNNHSTNEHKYETKMTAWLQTPQGFAFATTGKKLKPPLPPQPTFLAGIDPNVDIPSFADSDHYKYEILPTISAATAWWEDTKSAGGISGVPWTTSQKASLKAWTGGIYGSMNKWLYEGKDTSDSHKNHVKNAQLGMRPSTKPVLLHRGTGRDAFDVSTHEELEQLVGSTLVQDGFGASSIGGTAAFSGMPMLIEIEAPPGTPMAWVAPFSNYGTSEREMLLAAGLHYKIISVKKGPYGQSIVRVRIVPKPAGV